MTAGQRNCCTAIDECIRRYSLDDVLFAVREHILLQGWSECSEGSTERKAFVRVFDDLDSIRERLAGLLTPASCESL